MYPRRYCLGLIEASYTKTVALPGCSGIRGVIASASLKPFHINARAVVRNVYPRRYCLGLIEARPVAPCKGYISPAYPRRYCLGLIEALWSASMKASASPVSEALLPRPH